MKRLGLVALALGLGVGCYPGDPTSISEFDTVLTVRNPDFAFSEALSFYMPDTIVQINEDDDDAIEIGRDNDEEILARVRSNLLAQGWTELTREDIQNGGQIPDLAIGNLVMATENTQWWVSYPPGCWDPWWCWGWYWPPIYGSTTYRAGSYFVVAASALDITDPGNTDELEVAWSGAMNGVLAQNTGSNFDRLLDGIDQMFEQSPYLSGPTPEPAN
jgi:hypothetical protein